MSELNEAIASILGKSELADAIIKRRFGDMVSESAAVPVELDEEDYDQILDDVLSDQFNATGEKATRQLLTVVLKLAEQVAELNDQLDALESDVPPQDTSDEERQEQIAKFRESLQGSRVGDLKCYYTKTMLQGLKKETRFLVAKELVEYASSRGKEPAQLWALLAQNNGAM